MKEQIKNDLSRVEKENDIKILYAVESGSRAWGFASTDSDWDVRFIYVHSLDWYLQIDDKKDNIEKMLPHDIDLAGWDLKKALKLFRKSNPPLLEWLQSPIVYLEGSSTAKTLRDYSKFYFSPKSCLHHYFHMAEGNYRAYLQADMVRVKKYFYVLRPILACDWIREKNTMPPIEFDILLESQISDSIIRAEIEKLLERKISGEELNTEKRIQPLNDFLNSKIDFYRDYVKNISESPIVDTLLLNDLFRSTLKEVW